MAPTPRASGGASPEQMARLRAAHQNQPRQQSSERAEMPRAEPRSPAAAPRGAEADRQQPRFGINSLINRMTGHGEQPAGQAQPQRQQPQPQAQRPQPQAQQPSGPRQAPNWSDDGETDPEQERIEIPAFLRRQAN